ncbi:MAG TPA: BON domain-containing protein, partial [Opitutus sp.]|nr:BON domain-containing protein [Opitutus sp.]
DYVGNDHEYLISFNQLMASPDRRGELATTLTRSDFERAEPARENWAGVTTGYPYVWTGYTYHRGIGYTAADPAMRSESVARDMQTGDRRMTVADVRAALDRDTELSNAARHITLTQENNKLVLRGTATSKALKEKLADRVEELAKGWNVDDEIKVRSATE